MFCIDKGQDDFLSCLRSTSSKDKDNISILSQLIFPRTSGQRTYLVPGQVPQRKRTTYLSCPRSSSCKSKENIAILSQILLMKDQDNISVLSKIKFLKGWGQHTYLILDQVSQWIRTTFLSCSRSSFLEYRTTYVSCPRSSFLDIQDNIPILSQIKFLEGQDNIPILSLIKFLRYSGQHTYLVPDQVS